MRYLGVDGGGTKTAFSVYDEDLRALARFELASCHYAQAGIAGACRVLEEGAARARETGLLEGDFGIGFGICGYGENPRADRELEAACARIAAGAPHVLVNDVEAAWAAGLSCRDGIALIAGTGSIALGVRGGSRMRCGGWDFEIGDEGSAGWMGKAALAAFTRQADGRDERGALHALMTDRLELSSDFQIIDRARALLADRTACAALARLVSEAALAGDASAARIFERAAREEADMVGAICRALFPDAGPASVPVACIGGTFRAGDLIERPLARALPRCCRLVEPDHEPDLGAILVLMNELRGRDRRE